MMNKNKNNQYGRTMLETILYLSIVGILTAAMFFTIAKIFGRITETKNVTQFISLMQSIRERYAGIGSYHGVTPASLIEDGVVPTNMQSGDKTKILNKYGEEILIETSDVEEYHDLLYVAMLNIKKNDCIAMVNVNWMQNPALPVVSITIVNQETNASKKYGYSYDDTIEYGKFPINMNDVAQLCTGKSKIVWEFN